MRQKSMHNKHEFDARSYKFVDPTNACCVISEHCKYCSANIWHSNQKQYPSDDIKNWWRHNRSWCSIKQITNVCLLLHQTNLNGASKKKDNRIITFSAPSKLLVSKRRWCCVKHNFKRVREGKAEDIISSCKTGLYKPQGKILFFR